MKEPEFAYRAQVVKVIDGDTVDLRVDLGFHVEVAIRTRLYGINAPELSTKEGKAARDFLRTLLPIDTLVNIKTYKDPGDKYGRWLAKIHNGTTDCAEIMLKQRMAAVYNG